MNVKQEHQIAMTLLNFVLTFRKDTDVIVVRVCIGTTKMGNVKVGHYLKKRCIRMYKVAQDLLTKRLSSKANRLFTHRVINAP